MSLDTQDNNVGDWLKGEEEIPQLYSREVVTLLAGSGTLVSGQVLGKVTATGKFIPLDADGSSGEPAGGILLHGRVVGSTSDDDAAVPIVANMKVIIGSVRLELKRWNRPGWVPPSALEKLPP